MIRCLQLRPGACARSGHCGRYAFLPSLTSIRLPPARLLLVLLNYIPLLLWLRRDLATPQFFTMAAAPPQQQHAHIDCVMYIYADAQQDPTETIDQTSCPTEGGNRAFLVDKGRKGGSFPRLLEVAPLSDHKFLCKAKRPCNLVITGYGLEQGDRLILVHLDDSGSPLSCPPEELTAGGPQYSVEPQQTRAARHIRTSSKLAYDHSIRPQNEHTIMTVFELGQPQEGNYFICYSTSRSVPKQTPQLKDFHYKAGSLGKSDIDLKASLSTASIKHWVPLIICRHL